MRKKKTAGGRIAPAVNVNQLIIDYVYFCELRHELLDFDGFRAVWEAATEIAKETAPEDREMVLDMIFPEPTD